MPASSLWLRLAGAVLVLLPGLLLLRSSVRRVRKAVTVRAAKSVAAGDLSPGDLVSVEGEAVPLTDERIPAHLLDEDGLAVGTQVKRESGASNEYGGGQQWKTGRSHFAQVPFAVDDGTGRIAVDVPAIDAFPSEVDFWDSVQLKARTVADSDPDVRGRAEEFDEYAFDGETSIGETTTTRRYTQGILHEGDTVAVTGRVRRNADGDLVLADETASFALSNTGDRGPSARDWLVSGVGRGVLAGLLVALGGGAVALPLLPL